MGYWKNHPDEWPVASLILGDETYTAAELLTLLKTPPKGDASTILAHQLITAKLNAANGADDSAIAGTIIAADDWLDDYSGKLPYDVPAGSQAGKEATALARTLDDYNNGKIGPGHCDDIVAVTPGLSIEPSDLTAGERVSVVIRLSEDINEPFDYYVIADVRSQWYLVCISVNLRKMYRVWLRKELQFA